MISKETIANIEQDIRQVYQSSASPWVIGYSGGKDSTAALQLVWNALVKLPREKLNKNVFVISSDTLVETPVIVDYINNSIDKINQAAKKDKLPFEAVKVKPLIKDSFWINLIGKGYPLPYTRFRWCTSRLKIEPANRFILDKVAAYGDAVIVLGVRKAESATRAQVMNLHKIEGQRLSRHSSLPGAFVFAPIENLTTDEVWSYLLQEPSPWGNNNHYLFDLYKAAHDGECPLVIDKTTPSCGNSRFGCWVCTVVTKDLSMISMIESGEEWLRPLHDYREFLVGTRDPHIKNKYRDFKRRNGQVLIKEIDGTDQLIRGAFILPYKQKMLRKLLETQNKLRKTGPYPDIQLILPDELQEIRKIWKEEDNDWEDSLPTIYQEVTGETLDWVEEDHVSFSGQDKEILETVCKNHDVQSRLVAQLLELERQYQGMNRRSLIYERIDSLLKQDWRTEEEITNQD
jgi:DNA sulfur modification protein DndC